MQHNNKTLMNMLITLLLKCIYFCSVVYPYFNADPNSRIWWHKIGKFYSWKKSIFKLKFGLHEGLQATREASSPHTRLSSISKYKFSLILFCGPFLPSLIRIRIHPIKSNTDQLRSGSVLSTQDFCIVFYETNVLRFCHSNNGDLPACFNIFTEQREYPPPPPTTGR